MRLRRKRSPSKPDGDSDAAVLPELPRQPCAERHSPRVDSSAGLRAPVHQGKLTGRRPQRKYQKKWGVHRGNAPPFDRGASRFLRRVQQVTPVGRRRAR
jgi:hypothetical protein